MLKTLHRAAAMPLALLVLVALCAGLLACSGSDESDEEGAAVGGSSQSSESTDDETRKAEEALADEERAAQDALDQAKADLDAAIAAVDPCDPDVEQMTDILEPLATMQQMGEAGDAATNAAMASQARLIQSIARAQAGGSIPGLDPTTLTNLADAAGLDPTAEDWMSDPECAHAWRIEIDWDQSFGAGGVGVGVGYSGSADFSASPGDGFASGAGPLDFETALALPNCQVAMLDKSTEGFRVTGTYRNDRIAGEARIGDASYNLRLQCGDAPPIYVPGSISELTMPFDLPDEDGATQTITFPGMGEVTFTLRDLGGE
ncbi:MAG: hypothetical protein H6674_04245 [Dehalococcoidia bacterium]|nr:hypothetical protein [Dehalococcoidia bacterium]